MTRVVALIIFLLLCGNINAKPFSRLIFFGDSMTDNGNLYSATFGLYPPSPPYFKGRFSNGPTWAENVGRAYQKTYGSPYEIYAFGGATSAFYLPSKNFIAPTSLGLEVSQYLFLSLFKDQNNVLFVIWIGANDYIFFGDKQSLDSKHFKVVDGVTDAVKRLINHGAKNFLILNLTDASRAPYFRDSSKKKALHDNIDLYNLNLEIALAKLRAKFPDTKIITFNTYDFFNDYVDHPDKYNYKYHINITDTKNYCLKATFSIADLFKRKLFSVDDQNLVCQNPNSVVYWDSLHLTETFHQVLYQLIMEKIKGI